VTTVFKHASAVRVHTSKFRFPAVLVLALLILAALSTGTEGKPDDGVVLKILFSNDPQIEKDGQFKFSVLYTPSAGQITFDEQVICGEQVECSPGSPTKSPGFAKTPYTATFSAKPPDALEITAYLTIKGSTEGFYKTKSAIVRLGINNHLLESTIEPSTPLSGGSIQNTFFHFKDGKEVVTPALPVELTLTSDCAYLSHGGDKDTPAKTIQIRFGDLESPSQSSEQIAVEPRFWDSETCPIYAEGIIRGSSGATAKVGPFSASIPVKPAYVPALLMAVLGALFQYVFANSIKHVVDAQSQREAVRKDQQVLAPEKERDTIRKMQYPHPKWQESLRSALKFLHSIFVGPKGSYVISGVLKGLLAFFVAVFMKDSNVFGITVERGTFVGFFTLGVFFGFWPIEKLWAAFAKLAGFSETNATTQAADGTGIKQVPPSAASPAS
jgi:hypothetical protein